MLATVPYQAALNLSVPCQRFDLFGSHPYSLAGPSSPVYYARPGFRVSSLTLTFLSALILGPFTGLSLAPFKSAGSCPILGTGPLTLSQLCLGIGPLAPAMSCLGPVWALGPWRCLCLNSNLPWLKPILGLKPWPLTAVCPPVKLGSLLPLISSNLVHWYKS